MQLEERQSAVILGDRELTTVGSLVKVGQQAPDFELTTMQWQTVTLADYAGKVKLISVVPSLDTRVCDTQTHRFNEAATKLSDEVVVLTVSADLPYAQRRWCGAAGDPRVITLSDHMSMSFGDAYGVHIKELRLCQRSVFVLDASNRVVYTEYVRPFGQEPNYEAALAAVQEAVLD
jgi:thiol peroxidase